MRCDCAFVTSYELWVASFKFDSWEYAFPQLSLYCQDMVKSNSK